MSPNIGGIQAGPRITVVLLVSFILLSIHASYYFSTISASWTTMLLLLQRYHHHHHHHHHHHRHHHHHQSPASRPESRLNAVTALTRGRIMRGLHSSRSRPRGAVGPSGVHMRFSSHRGCYSKSCAGFTAKRLSAICEAASDRSRISAIPRQQQHNMDARRILHLSLDELDPVAAGNLEHDYQYLYKHSTQAHTAQ